MTCSHCFIRNFSFSLFVFYNKCALRTHKHKHIQPMVGPVSECQGAKQSKICFQRRMNIELCSVNVLGMAWNIHNDSKHHI